MLLVLVKASNLVYCYLVVKLTTESVVVFCFCKHLIHLYMPLLFVLSQYTENVYINNNKQTSNETKAKQSEMKQVVHVRTGTDEADVIQQTCISR